MSSASWAAVYRPWLADMIPTEKPPMAASWDSKPASLEACALVGAGAGELGGRKTSNAPAPALSPGPAEARAGEPAAAQAQSSSAVIAPGRTRLSPALPGSCDRSSGCEPAWAWRDCVS